MKFVVVALAMMGLLCLSSGPASAAPRRPLKTDDALRGEPGAFEFFVGYHTSDNNTGETVDWLEFGLTHTVTERLEVALSLNHQMEPESGFEPLEFETKFSFFEESNGVPGLAASAGFSPGSSDYSITGIATRAFGPADMSVNLGTEATGDPSEEGPRRLPGPKPQRHGLRRASRTLRPSAEEP